MQLMQHPVTGAVGLRAAPAHLAGSTIDGRNSALPTLMILSARTTRLSPSDHRLIHKLANTPVLD